VGWRSSLLDHHLGGQKVLIGARIDERQRLVEGGGGCVDVRAGVSADVQQGDTSSSRAEVILKGDDHDCFRGGLGGDRRCRCKRDDKQQSEQPSARICVT
jgi:hypothetical protein